MRTTAGLEASLPRFLATGPEAGSGAFETFDDHVLIHEYIRCQSVAQAGCHTSDAEYAYACNGVANGLSVNAYHSAWPATGVTGRSRDFPRRVPRRIDPLDLLMLLDLVEDGP